jgi:hypothetical protein
MIECSNDQCRIHLTPHSTGTTGTFTAVPTTVLGIRRNDYGLYCLFSGSGFTDDLEPVTPVFGPVTARLVGTPGVHLRYASVVQ